MDQNLRREKAKQTGKPEPQLELESRRREKRSKEAQAKAKAKHKGDLAAMRKYMLKYLT